MEMVGNGAEQNSGPEPKAWFRCTRCKHSSLVSIAEIERIKKAATAAIVRENCTPYSKEKVYAVGDEIIHTDWDDVGRVVRKDKTSGGVQTIIVSFEKVGERTLIENATFEEQEEPSVPEA